ncbi:MAG: hypothetical protein WCR46_08765 [Deltaproteobacteria bacterium]
MTVELSNQSTGNKKLLAVYDLATQPLSIGDVLLFVAGATAIAYINQTPSIDYIFISDPSRQPQDPVFEDQQSNNNHLLNATKLCPIALLFAKIGSLLILNSFEDFEKYYQDNQSRSILWPSSQEIAARKYMYYDIWRMLAAYHRAHRDLPQFFTMPGEIQKWVFNFFKTHVGNCISVTINIRNNKEFHMDRNSDIDQLLELFRLTQDVPIKFIIICSKSEIDDRLLNLSNVVVAKSFSTSIIQDLALIHYAQLHLASASGPATMPILNNKPYIAYNMQGIIPYLALYGDSLRIIDQDKAMFSFAAPNQYLRFKQQTAETMLSDLAEAMKSIDPQNIQALDAPDCKTLAWLD